MAGTIRPNDMNMAATPTMAASALPGLSLQTDGVAKKPSAPRTPRVDVEPLHAAVKGAISDADWATYKKSLSSFLLGNLNQDELSHALSRILTTPALEHAHNALFMAICANVWRDPPEAGIASWVSSSDKPSSGLAKGTHDESEKRLKQEIMQLSRRERKRLKTIPAGDAEGFGTGPAVELVEARKAKQPESGPMGGNQGGGFGKTNWDLEIRKRYTGALFAETHEFPTATTISHRLLPTCYEFGLPQGHSNECAEYLNLATETYIKEALMSLLGKVSANGPGFIRTGEFKKRVDREERMVERGEMIRIGGIGGELPVEAEARRSRKMLCMEDLRLALQLGDGYLGQTPLIAGSIFNSRCLDTEGIEGLYETKHLTNGDMNGVGHGGEVWNVQFDLGGDPMQIDGEDGWTGGGVDDGRDLDSALDDVLNFADL